MSQSIKDLLLSLRKPEEYGLISLTNVNKGGEEKEEDVYDVILNKVGVFDVESNGEEILIGTYNPNDGYKANYTLYDFLNHTRAINYYYGDYDLPVIALLSSKFVKHGKFLGMNDKIFINSMGILQKRKNSYVFYPYGENFQIKFYNLLSFYATSLYNAYVSNYRMICEKAKQFDLDELCFNEHELKTWKEDKGKRTNFKGIDLHSKEILYYNELDVKATYALVLTLPELYPFGNPVKKTISSFSASYVTSQANYSFPNLPKDLKVSLILFHLYKGGYFDSPKLGVFQYAYKYDVNSMYPYFTSQLPLIKDIKIELYDKPQPFKLSTHKKHFYMEGHKVRDDVDEINIYYGTFYQESPSVQIKYNNHAIKAQHFHTAFFDFEALGNVRGYLYGKITLKIDPKVHPFEKVIRELYTKRKELKKAKSPQEVAYKLMLNSFYGKFVERIGANAQFQNIIYGAMITAMGRTYIQSFKKYHPLTFLTDSIITPLKLPKNLLGDELGQFKMEGKGKVYLIGNGQYYLLDDEEPFSKLRGYTPSVKYGNIEQVRRAIIVYLGTMLSRGIKKVVKIEEDLMVKSEQTLHRKDEEKKPLLDRLITNIGLLYSFPKYLYPTNAKRVYKYNAKHHYYGGRILHSPMEFDLVYRKIQKEKEMMKAQALTVDQIIQWLKENKLWDEVTFNLH